MNFQDQHGPLRSAGIFHDGQLIADAPDDQAEADQLRNTLAAKHPGREVLSRCNTHPDTPAVDCLVCWPDEGDTE